MVNINLLNKKEAKMNNCTYGCMTGINCNKPAEWRNQNGVEVCEYHKLVLDTFTWENRNERKWELIENKQEV
jgi:hypothetical protein